MAMVPGLVIAAKLLHRTSFDDIHPVGISKSLTSSMWKSGSGRKDRLKAEIQNENFSPTFQLTVIIFVDLATARIEQEENQKRQRRHQQTGHPNCEG